MIKNRVCGFVLLAIAAFACCVRISAQELTPPRAKAVPADDQSVVPAERGVPAYDPEGPGDPTKPPQLPVGKVGKPLPNSNQPGGKPAEVPKPEAPKTTPRPTKPPTPANPDELKVRPDDDGRVRFNFQGQPWIAVLEWLAKISQLSLDWQEVPADYLNLRTQRSYTVDEARDLINRHLLDRGFTLLKHGEVLTVVNIKKLDPSLVPRVAPEDLDDREPHEFVKVSFPLDSLTALTATEELKPMLSPNGKLSPLKATNRIEALDAVVNLREIRDVLNHEQSYRGRKRLVSEFKLEYTRAGEVIEQLRELLGLEKKAVPPQPGGRQQNIEQQMMMQQQMAMQMAEMSGEPGEGGGRRVANPMAQPKQAPAVQLVLNPRENSIMAHAPADQMAVIAEAVKLIDVPSSRSQSLMKNINRTQVYRMATIDPEPLVKMLNELGDLDPTTRLQIDKKNRSIIAYASLADHMTIRTLVTRLDGTDRKFEVIKLRRLEADYVAGTIELMMGAGEKKKNRGFNPFFFDWGGNGQNNAAEEESQKFRVDADIEHNRLLLWANTVELEEINHLLVKLGELPAEGGNLSTLRVIDTIPPEEVKQLLERLRRTWPGIGPNRLDIVSPPDESEEPDDPPVKKKPAAGKKAAPAKVLPDEATAKETSREKLAGSPETPASLARLVQLADRQSFDAAGEAIKKPEPPRGKSAGRVAEETEPDPADVVDDAESEGLPSSPKFPVGDVSKKVGSRAGQRTTLAVPAPIKVGRGPDGRMVISSTDTEALDRLEELLSEMTPPRKDYKAFKLKYKTTWAYGVAMNLREFFDEKEKADQRRNRGWFWGMQNNNTDDSRRLSKRRPLKFISDSDSNSILVTGADPNQLKIIEDLIALYDVPESKDSAAVRKTRLVPLHHSKARVVATAVKDVYRDLLSANDPALQNNQNQRDKEKRDSGTTINYNWGDEGASDKPESRVKFKGLLSIGVDELSNTLVVSAEESLLETVTQTIEALDNAAQPTVSRLRVLKVDRTVNADELQKRLKSLLPKPAQPPQQRAPGQPPIQDGRQIAPGEVQATIEGN